MSGKSSGDGPTQAPTRIESLQLEMAAHLEAMAGCGPQTLPRPSGESCFHGKTLERLKKSQTDTLFLGGCSHYFKGDNSPQLK